MRNILVAYFSASGVTERAAQVLAEAAEADLYEIRPQVPYTRADLNWMDKHSRSTVEMNDRTFRPPLADTEGDVAGHEVIFLCFPIWWYVAPTIINTFLESYDFRDKTVVLFATSGGSGFGKTLEELKGSVSPSTVLREGRMLNGQLDPSELKQWVQNLGL